MKRLLLLVLLLPVAVLADHHRGHAIGHIDNAVQLLSDANFWLKKMYACKQWDDRELNRLDIAMAAIAQANTRAEQARIAINEGRLDDARRLMNQPAMLHGELKSALGFSRQMIEYAAILLQNGKCPDQSFARGLAFDKMSKAWNSFDFAAWHINDAIREEIYQDPAFICAGPGNHCE